jgi:hypothetical protein
MPKNKSKHTILPTSNLIVLCIVLATVCIGLGLLTFIITSKKLLSPKANRIIGQAYSPSKDHRISVRYMDFGGSFTFSCDPDNYTGCGGIWTFCIVEKKTLLATYSKIGIITCPDKLPCSAMMGACSKANLETFEIAGDTIQWYDSQNVIR